MRRTAFLWSLVALNLGITSACMAAGFLGNRGGAAWAIDYLNPGFLASCGGFFVQLWMLSLFTAFYDPVRRMARWLAIPLVVSVFVSALCAVHWGMHLDHVYADPSVRQKDADSSLAIEFLLLAEFGIPSVFVLMAMILLIQSICWPLRTALGWQITIGEKQRPGGRRFGTSNMLAWLGFFAVFFYLVTLFRDNPLFYAAAAIALLGTAATIPVAVGWLFLLGRRRVSILLAVVFTAAIALLCYAENEAALFALQQAVLAGVRVPLSFWAPQIIPFNCAAALTAFINLLVLRYAGVRLHAVKSSATSPKTSANTAAMPPCLPHSTTIAPQPSNSIP